MNLSLNLQLDTVDEKANERVKRAKEKVAKAKYEPSWEEIWLTGYEKKKGIFQTKLTDKDKERLREVKEAIEAGVLGTSVDSLRSFTKTKALALHKELIEIQRASIIEEMVKNMPSNYHLITTQEQLDELTRLLDKETVIALDTETTGVDIWGKDKIVGLSLTLPLADYHCYIPIRHHVEDVQLSDTLVLSTLKPYLENEELRKVLHNAKFDFHMLYKENIDVKGLLMDTMVAMHVCNENEPSYALKNLATKYKTYLGMEDDSKTYEELFGKGGFENTPLDIATVYACKDTLLTYKLYQFINSQFDRVEQLKSVYYDIELPNTLVSLEMERNGFKIDLEFAEKYKEELETEIAELEQQLAEAFGDININSNQQLAEVLYDKMGLEDVSKSRSVDKSTLKQLSNQCEAIQVLLKYRELNKLLTTYIIPLPDKLGYDGRLHGQFNQSGTATGRYSSNNPNLQNLPYNARKLIVAEEDKVIVGIDLSQIEPRLLSHVSQDKNFMSAYVEGRDLYSEIGSRTFKVPLEECGDGSVYRKKAKVILLGQMYGISSKSLADQFGISLQEADQIYSDFLTAYPRMAEWFKEINHKANTLGYVETLWGRKRRFIGHQQVAKKYLHAHNQITKIVGTEDYDLRNDKRIPYNLKKQIYETRSDYNRVMRQSINSVIQGGASDFLKITMIALYDYCKQKGTDFKMLATIHDEVLIEVPATDLKAIDELAEIMRTTVKLTVPMKVDVEVSKRWGAGVSLAEYKEQLLNV